MIRVFNLYVPSSKLLLVIGDALLLAVGFFLLLGPDVPMDTLAGVQLFVLVAFAAAIGIWSFYFSDLYDASTLRSRQWCWQRACGDLVLARSCLARWSGFCSGIGRNITLWSRSWL